VSRFKLNFLFSVLFHCLVASVAVCLLYYNKYIYRRLGGPPRVIPLAAAADCAGFLAPPVPVVVGGGLLFPGRGNLVPNCRSNLAIICGLGIAFPDSYSATTCGFSLIAVANSFCVIFFAVRACIIALLKDLSTFAIVPTSVASSSYVTEIYNIKYNIQK
jgi:hypothetical protein